MGGMVGGEAERRKVAGSTVAEAEFFRGTFDTAKQPPCVITVPKLTRRERQYLDGFMPCADGWTPADFELSGDSVRAYRDVYRFCPSYAEMIF